MSHEGMMMTRKWRRVWISLQRGLLFICLLLLVMQPFPVALSQHCYKGDKNYTIVRNGKHFYMIKNEKTYHRLPDRYTINIYGCDVMVPHPHFDLGPYEEGSALPSLWDHHANAGMLQYAADATYLKMPQKVLGILNPAFTIWKNNLVISWRPTGHSTRIAWFPASSMKSNSASFYADLSMYLRSFNDDVKNGQGSIVTFDMENAEDPRLFTTISPTNSSDERLFLIYASRHRRKTPEIFMNYVELFPSRAEGKITIDDIEYIHFEELPGQDQKNWSPFQYEDQMLFIQHGIPHRVVVCDKEKDRTYMAHGRTVGLTEVMNTTYQWKFGEIRGGSPAMKITIPKGHDDENDTFYLTFFHSSIEPPMTGENVLRTYVMGAYIFESTPPFGIRAISEVPIVHENMYTGPWTNLPISFYHLDYVVFPTAFTVDVSSDTVTLMYGWQDKEGYLTEISLSGLLKSLKPVSSRVLKKEPEPKSNLI